MVGIAQDIEAVLYESGPDFDDFSFQRPTAAHQGEVYLVSLEYAGEQYEIVVKFKPRTDEEFALEPFLHEYVADRTHVPVPRILVYEEEPEADVPPYFVTERVEGHNLAESLASIDGSVREQVIEQAGRILGDMHAQIGFEGFGRLSLNQADNRIVVDEFSWDWQQFFHDVADVYIGKMGTSRFDDLQSTARDRLDESIGVIESEGVPRLVHDDFRPANMLFDQTRAEPITAILDWQFALAAEPEYHVAKTEFLFIEPTFRDAQTRDRLRELLYSGYREHRNFDPDGGYERRRTVYHFATLLWRMAGFSTSFAEFTELARGRAEARFRKRFADLAEQLPEA